MSTDPWTPRPPLRWLPGQLSAKPEEPEHDDRCEAFWVEGAMAWHPCACADRARCSSPCCANVPVKRPWSDQEEAHRVRSGLPPWNEGAK